MKPTRNSKDARARPREGELLRARLNGSEVAVHVTGLDDKGRAYDEVGYQLGWITKKRQQLQGRIHWLGGHWCFTPFKQQAFKEPS